MEKEILKVYADALKEIRNDLALAMKSIIWIWQICRSIID